MAIMLHERRMAPAPSVRKSGMPESLLQIQSELGIVAGVIMPRTATDGANSAAITIPTIKRRNPQPIRRVGRLIPTRLELQISAGTRKIESGITLIQPSAHYS